MQTPASQPETKSLASFMKRTAGRCTAASGLPATGSSKERVLQTLLLRCQGVLNRKSHILQLDNLHVKEASVQRIEHTCPACEAAHFESLRLGALLPVGCQNSEARQ